MAAFLFAARECGRLNMKRSRLEAMPLDDLWTLHETVASILALRIEAQKRDLEKRLERLGGRLGASSNDNRQRRAYPKVYPKFQNPTRPSETWSGRGKQPRWVVELLGAGRAIDDFRI
jgi:DNA-binding protein H-NS